MIKDHNLDDLIIDDIKPANSKSKGILTIVALFVALLIVATIMTRIFLGESDQNSTLPAEKQAEIISPDLKLDTTHQVKESEKKELDQLSTVMEETSDNKPAAATESLTLPEENKTDLIKPQTAQINETVEENTTLLAPANEVAPEPLKEDLAPQEVSEPAKEDLAPQERAQPEQSTPAAQADETAQPEEIQADRPQPVKQTPPAKKSSKPKPKQTEEKFSQSGSFYIQVGSFAKEPSKQFLNVITKNGFQYKMENGKLLIGPYANDAAARSDLPSVKNKINKSAFIKH